MANYQANINKANPTTIQLLEQTVDKLGDLLGSVDEIEDSRNESIIFSIDDTKFDVKRSIYCRMCEVCPMSYLFCVCIFLVYYLLGYF